jgi:subtilisin family serine protease
MTRVLKTPLALLCAAALAACAGPAGKPQPLPPGMDTLMDKAKSKGVVRVIAVLRAPSGQALTPQSLNSLQLAAVTDMRKAGVAVAAPLSGQFPLVVAEVNSVQLTAMAKDSSIAQVVEDELALASLADSGPLVGAPQAHALGARGGGQTVAILDTGVDAAHPFFGGRLKGEACFSTTSASQGATSACPNGQSSMIGAGAAKPCAADGCDHGTHVAGIAAGGGPNFSGMAPDAAILAVQVFSVFDARTCAGFGQTGPCVASFTSDQIRALDYVLNQARAAPIAAINMSLGGGRSTGACDNDVTKPVIDDLRAAGVATVIAAGNDGFRDSVSRPGCISTAITVAATDKSDRIARFSNLSPVVDVFAPGVSIQSAVPPDRFAALSGTSMAAPHIAGAIAGLRSLKPGASLAEIEAALARTGVAIPGQPAGLQIGRFDFAAAARQLAGPPQENAVTSSDAKPASADALATIAAMPADQKVRVIVALAAPANDPAANAAAIAAAQAAGCTATTLRSGMILVEGPAQAVGDYGRSAFVRGVQIDAAARPQ